MAPETDEMVRPDVIHIVGWFAAGFILIIDQWMTSHLLPLPLSHHLGVSVKVHDYSLGLHWQSGVYKTRRIKQPIIRFISVCSQVW